MSKLDKIKALAKTRGFFYPSSEIYGGIAGTYDYGTNGTLLKRKLENLWRSFFLGLDSNFLEIEPVNIMPEKVFIASGHLKNFVDPITICKKCKTEYRADHILEDILKENCEGFPSVKMDSLIKKHKIRCVKCKGELSEVHVFNMTFPLDIGVKSDTTVYLRPETAQGVYINFLKEFSIQRRSLPLGLSIIGKAFRNEISPRNLLIRMREFTQAELQIFFDPDKINDHENWNDIRKYKLMIKSTKNNSNTEMSCDNINKKLKIPKFFVYYMAKVQKFYLSKLKIPKDVFRFRELSDKERAFYNKIHFDVELNLNSLGWKEISGVHYRGSHDLEGHQKISGKNMTVTINDKKFIPHILELSFGVDRIIFALFDLFYVTEKNRNILKLPKTLSVFDVCVFPLVKKDGLKEKACSVYDSLKNNFSVFYDDAGSVGKRYRRIDEIGVNYSVTIDHDSLDKNTCTIRDRNSMIQITVPIENLSIVLRDLIDDKIEFKTAGKIIK
jgi:glycyl-tRNA synthetase